MAQIAVEFTDTTMRIQSQAFSCEFPEVEKVTVAYLPLAFSTLPPPQLSGILPYLVSP